MREFDASIEWSRTNDCAAENLAVNRLRSDAMHTNAAQDPFASHRPKELYSGYFDKLASERKELNDRLTLTFSSLEKLIGFSIGTYGIYGSTVNAGRKWLKPPQSLVAKMPTAFEEHSLAQLSEQMKGLAGLSTAERAVLSSEMKAIENAVLNRARLHAFGGLAVGLTLASVVDRVCFKHDTLGDGSAVTDLIGAPLLASCVPGNFAVKAAAVAGVAIAGKLIDHFNQPHYFYNPRDLFGKATPLPPSLFTPEDRANQKTNWEKQQSELGPTK